MNQQWYLWRDGQRYGPYAWEDLLAFVRAGNVLPSDLVWGPSLSDWAPAGQIPGLLAPSPPVTAMTAAKPASARPRRGWIWFLTGAVVVLALFATAAWFLWLRDRAPDAREMTASRLTLELTPNVAVLEGATVSADGGTVSVNRPGDPLHGLAIQVPADSFGEPVSFDISYQPITGQGGTAPVKVISPLIEIDNGGAVAEAGVILRIPVKVPKDQFPMAFFYDEASGALEGLPALAFDGGSVTVATQHFSAIIVTAEDYAALEHFEVDTGFAPGKDTWQFQNRGTYTAPRGICWGMSVSSLWYYLEEPWRISGQRLWGQIDNSLGADLKTPEYWQDDDWGLKVATALQANYDSARRDRSFDIVYQLERELEGSGNLLNVRLTQDQIAFYSLVSAMALTNEPQLVNITTADGKRGHSLIAYKIEGAKVFVADPNDYQSSPPLRTLTLEDGKFSAYSASENVLDQLAGIQSGYTQIRYWGQSALTHWQQVGSLWSQGDRQPGYPEYRLLVVERDADGNVTQEYDLDLLNPLHTTQRELELRIVPPDGVDARFSLRHFGLLDAELNPLPLAEGENLVGIYVEGKAHWVDGDGRPQTDWRWLGFDWITVIQEQPTPTPTATATSAPETSTPTAAQTTTPTGTRLAPTETPRATPTVTLRPAARSFTEADCTCDALGPLSVTVESANESFAWCKYGWKVGEQSGKLSLRIIKYTDPYAQLAATKENLAQVCGGASECVDSGHQFRVLENSDERYTSYAHDLGWSGDWDGRRAVVYRGQFYIFIAFGVPGPSSEAAIIAQVDQIESCARAAADRYLGE